VDVVDNDLVGADTPMPMSWLSYFAHSERWGTRLIDGLHGSPISRGPVLGLCNAGARTRTHTGGCTGGCAGRLADWGLGDKGRLC